MKKILIYIGISFYIILLSECFAKEFQSESYFDGFTKDEILEASKLSILINEDYEYVIDSYRNRLEITKISVLFGNLMHKDFVLYVDENECGTNASLKISINEGIDKTASGEVSEKEYQLFWDNIKLFLFYPEEISSKNKNSIEKLKKNKIYRKIKPTKNMKECFIKNEFENGFIKSKSTLAEAEDETL